MKHLPQVKIGHIEYDITDVPNLVTDSGQSLFGNVSYSRETIQLDKNLTPARRLEVLLHEIVHAIINEYGHEQNETLVNAVGLGLANVIVDNKQLLPYLQRLSKKARKE